MSAPWSQPAGYPAYAPSPGQQQEVQGQGQAQFNSQYAAISGQQQSPAGYYTAQQAAPQDPSQQTFGQYQQVPQGTTAQQQQPFNQQPQFEYSQQPANTAQAAAAPWQTQSSQAPSTQPWSTPQHVQQQDVSNAASMWPQQAPSAQLGASLAPAQAVPGYAQQGAAPAVRCVR